MNFTVNNRKGEVIARTEGSRLQLDTAILAAAEGMVEIRFAVPILDFAGFWTPELFRPKTRLDWKITLDSAGNRNWPFLLFFNLAGRNRFCCYSTNLLDDTCFELVMNQEQCEYDVTVRIAILPETEPFELILDHSDRPWTELPGIARRHLGIAAPPVTPEAWAPVYCTWYASHAALTIDALDRESALASELGFGTFIVDDGWSYDRAKRVRPENVATWYEEIGPWRVSKQKLPSFAAHVERARKRGLRYLLWSAPFFLGARHTSPEIKTFGGEPGSYEVLEPTDAYYQTVLDELGTLIRDYHLDGLKVDFLAHVPTSPERPRGRAAHRAIRQLSERIRQENPRALIEFRQFYSTPATLALATQFRANDSPFDYLENFCRIVQLHLMLGDGAAVHADPVYWHPRESLLNINRHLIAAIAGVPMLSMKLSTLPEEQKNAIRDWLGFYQEHRDLFRSGHWQAVYTGETPAALTVEGDGGKIVWLLAADGIEALSDADWVLSLAGRPLDLPGFGRLAPGCRLARSRIAAVI